MQMAFSKVHTARKVIYVRFISCSHNNGAKSICLLDKKSNSCLYRKNFMQVGAFERYINRHKLRFAYGPMIARF